MQVHQAVYGSKSRGHALLGASDERLIPIFRAAAWATDLPSTVPTGIAWEPYLKTVRIENYFVLVFTRPDEAATRAGMVTSRAAFLPLELLPHVDDIEPIAKALSESIEFGQLKPLEIECSPGRKDEERTAFVDSIATAVVSTQQFPVVCFGQMGFNDVMVEMWRRVPAELRPNLLFGLSFGPDDTVDRNLVVVATPADLQARWTGYTSASWASNSELPVAAAALLNVERGRELRNFANEMGMSICEVRDLSVLEHALNLWNDAQTTLDLLTFVRLLAAKSNSKGMARALKVGALDKLVGCSQTWSASDVLAMRNLNLADFESANSVWNTLSDWSRQLELYAQKSPREVGRILINVVRVNAVDAWVEAVRLGLRDVFGAESSVPNVMNSIWLAMAAEPEYCEDLLDLAAHTVSFGQIWSTTHESIDIELGTRIAQIAAHRHWWELAGAAVKLSHAPSDAAGVILQLNLGFGKRRAIAIALANEEARTLAQVAVEYDDEDIIELAGQACAAEPEALQIFDWRNPTWFEIFEVAWRCNDAVINHLPDRLANVDKLLAAEDFVPSDRIWIVLANTALGDLSSATNRSLAWTKIPSNAVTKILDRTLNGWFSEYEEALEYKEQPERFLWDAIQARVKEPGFLIEVANRSTSLFVRMMRDIFAGSDTDAKAAVQEMSLLLNHLDYASARVLGALIQERRWYVTASTVGTLATRRKDFAPVALDCFGLLPWYDRVPVALALGWSAMFSDDEAWGAIETEATVLYPSGPSHNELWSRSGGKNEELPMGESGKAIWHKCLKELRAGRGPEPARLIAIMLEDYPRNETLRELKRHKF